MFLLGKGEGHQQPLFIKWIQIGTASHVCFRHPCEILIWHHCRTGFIDINTKKDKKLWTCFCVLAFHKLLAKGNNDINIHRNVFFFFMSEFIRLLTDHLKFSEQKNCINDHFLYKIKWHISQNKNWLEISYTVV